MCAFNFTLHVRLDKSPGVLNEIYYAFMMYAL